MQSGGGSTDIVSTTLTDSGSLYQWLIDNNASVGDTVCLWSTKTYACVWTSSSSSYTAVDPGAYAAFIADVRDSYIIAIPNNTTPTTAKKGAYICISAYGICFEKVQTVEKIYSSLTLNVHLLRSN